MALHNRVNRKELEKRLMEEPFKRSTLSFYRYFIIEDPQELRDTLYKHWSPLNCFGRVYVAHEGINAQMSVPEHCKDEFVALFGLYPELKDIPIKWAVEDDGRSFSKLTIKVRPKLVADGLPDGFFDVTNVGTHLTPLEFHKAIEEPDSLVVDMRNHYESEIGRFEKAVCADSDTFSEGIAKITELLKDQKEKKILLYCTGGIRCEKASAYLRHHGFKNVSQLYGGIIEYGNTVKQLNIPSKFKGKNFVFDRRLGENIDGTVLSRCHQCGELANKHINCANSDCHILFIQCEKCAEKYESCCSNTCQSIIHLPGVERIKLRPKQHRFYSRSRLVRIGEDLLKC